MRWSKSVSLVVFVLVAVLVTSIVGGRVWAQSGGGGTTGANVSSQVVPTPVAPACKVTVTTVFTAGVKDNFAPGNAEPNSPGTALAAWMASNYPGGTQGFDGTVSDRVFGHTFTGLPPDITKAWLEFGVKAIKSNDPGDGESEYDGIGMYLNSPPSSPFAFAYGGSFWRLNSPNIAYPPYLTGGNGSSAWVTNDTTVLKIDLAQWPTLPQGILPKINNTHSLDVAVYDDTAVDYLILTVETCPPSPTTTYIYSVKLVCGTVTPPRPKPSIPTLRDPAPVVPGLYRTAVNIHNFWEKDTTFLQKVAIALPQDQERGPITKKVKENLRSNEAVEVDCYNVVAILEGTTAAKAEFLKGFVVIESPVELEVTAVYTAEELQENGISIDVEQIQPHVIRQSEVKPSDVTGGRG